LENEIRVEVPAVPAATQHFNPLLVQTAVEVSPARHVLLQVSPVPVQAEEEEEEEELQGGAPVIPPQQLGGLGGFTNLQKGRCPTGTDTQQKLLGGRQPIAGIVCFPVPQSEVSEHAPFLSFTQEFPAARVQHTFVLLQVP